MGCKPKDLFIGGPFDGQALPGTAPVPFVSVPVKYADGAVGTVVYRLTNADEIAQDIDGTDRVYRIRHEPKRVKMPEVPPLLLELQQDIERQRQMREEDLNRQANEMYGLRNIFGVKAIPKQE